MTWRQIEYRVIPPEADAEFVAHMEQVLDTSARPYDPACPVVCMDEQPVQLVQETRPPIAATREPPRRVDYEYERAGTASVFRFSRTAGGLAAGHGARPAFEGGLGGAGRRPVGGPLRRVPAGHVGLRQPQHAHEGGFYEVVEPAGHGSWFVASSSATRRSTGAG